VCTGKHKKQVLDGMKLKNLVKMDIKKGTKLNFTEQINYWRKKIISEMSNKL
jgi:hypothetical protein